MSKADEKYEKYAEDALAVLVERVLSSETVTGARIAYGDLSDLIEGPGPRNMDKVLGTMGRKLKNLKVRGNPVPKIQSLVINKRGGCPGDGFVEFYNGYSKLPKKEKKAVALQEQQSAYEFGNSWLDVLDQLGIDKKYISDDVSYPDEVESDSRMVEGAQKQVLVNRHERNRRARKSCVNHYGCFCSVCGFDFEQGYGEIGRGFIHVHHVNELSLVEEEYEVDPVNDLRPVCPNCHAMLHHKTRPARSIDDLKKIIAENKRPAVARKGVKP